MAEFAVFSKTEIKEMFQTMIEHMPENMRNNRNRRLFVL